MNLFIKKLRLSKHLVGHQFLNTSSINQVNEFSAFFIPKSDYLSHDNYDYDYYCDKVNLDEIRRNIQLRRQNNLISSLNQATDQHKWIKDNINLLPNKLHNKWKDRDVNEAKNYDKDQFFIEECGSKPVFKFEPKIAEDIYDNFGILILGYKGLGATGGKRSYLMMDDLVDLKNALVDFTLDKLIKKYKFNFVTVPNLIYNETLNACGFNIIGDRNLVYKLRNKNKSSDNSNDEYRSNQVCLSGTSEIPLAGLHLGEVLNLEDLPLRYCTISRCYRKEISFLKKESGIYRVHYFDKIEMFGLTDKHESDQLLNEFINIQKELFSDLQLPIKVLDMPPHELGSSAICKYDVECWLPGRNLYGEISSASNCSDYQSRRFNTKYKYLDPNYETNEPFAYEFVHTINGTACAIPRMLIAIGENYQEPNRQIRVPDVLKPYMNGTELIKYKRHIFRKKQTYW